MEESKVAMCGIVYFGNCNDSACVMIFAVCGNKKCLYEIGSCIR